MLHHLAEVIPVADLVFGGGVLILVMLVHATGLRLVGDHVSQTRATRSSHIRLCGTPTC